MQVESNNTNKEDNDATMALLTCFQQETKSADKQEKRDNKYSHVQLPTAAAEYKAVPICLHSSSNIAEAAPDLELTLAIPKANTNEPSPGPGPFLLGPISVT